LKQTIFYYGQLLKLRLSTTVVFSAVAGFLLGVDVFSFSTFICLMVGGFLVTGSANGFNQILEKEQDKLMERTAVRPLPKGNLSVLHASIFSIIIGVLGIYLLNFINPQGSFFGLMSKSGAFSLLSIALYVLVYTPLKRFSPLSISIGAIPGAIPFLLGFVAATDDFALAAGMLFAIQFFWQYPHFIAIVWVQEEAYKKAGFKMMFGGEKGKLAASIAIVTSVVMTVISITAYFYEIPNLNLSIYGAIIILMLGIWFTLKSIKLYADCEDSSAKKLMLSSFAYLPLMQIVYILDKYFIQ
jgi:protoheme IX farnesyltransferase|tara:strand:+ start:1900 stop:2796 length:897 start_codon:yes stop_codon:yes gene_type:complete